MFIYPITLASRFAYCSQAPSEECRKSECSNVHLLRIVTKQRLHVPHWPDWLSARRFSRASVRFPCQKSTDLSGRIRRHLHGCILSALERFAVVSQHRLDEIDVNPKTLPLRANHATTTKNAMSVL